MRSRGHVATAASVAKNSEPAIRLGLVINSGTRCVYKHMYIVSYGTDELRHLVDILAGRGRSRMSCLCVSVCRIDSCVVGNIQSII